MSGIPPLRIVSVCRSLPVPSDPSSGVFVLNRLAAMARQASVRALQPVPHFPVLAPLPAWARPPHREIQGLGVEPAPMFYIPGVLKHLDGMWLQRSVVGRIARLQKERGVDLIDAHFGYPEGAGCVAAGAALSIPTFVTVRGFENEFAERSVVGPAMLEALRRADGCIAVSHFLENFLLRHGVPAERIAVIHNAIDSRTFHYADASAARARLGLPADRRYIVSVGHLVSRKRHHVLIEAFARIRARHPDVILAIIGSVSFEQDYPRRLNELVERHGLKDAVRFVGNVPPVTVADWLRAAEIFALGTAREGCCNAVLEALAAGAPVVTTPAGDNAHFVKHGVNGMIVGIDQVDETAAALDTSMRAKWNRVQIAEALAAQVGTWDQVATRVLDFFAARLAQRKVSR
jgi:teichuronic acid biosynthesis glycosyltransferase TuaC